MHASIANHGMFLDTIRTRVHSLQFQIVVVCAVILFFNLLLSIWCPERRSVSLSLCLENSTHFCEFIFELNWTKTVHQVEEVHKYMQQCGIVQNKRNKMKWDSQWNNYASINRQIKILKWLRSQINWKKIELIINVFITKMFICFWYRQKLRYLGHLLKKPRCECSLVAQYMFRLLVLVHLFFCCWNLYIRITQIKSIMQSIWCSVSFSLFP